MENDCNHGRDEMTGDDLDGPTGPDLQRLFATGACTTAAATGSHQPHKEDSMEKKDDVTRFLRRHPHFRKWIYPRGRAFPEVVALQYAVIDQWRRRHAGDVDALYERLKTAVANWSTLHGRFMPLVELEEFSEAVDLYLLMVIDVPWPAKTGIRKRRPWEMAATRERAAVERNQAWFFPGSLKTSSAATVDADDFGGQPRQEAGARHGRPKTGGQNT